MKRIIIWSSAIALIGLFIGQTTFAADAKETGSAGKSPGASNEAGSEKPKLSQAELEANFKTTLTKATLTGRWCSINASPEGRLKMGPEKDEKYTIVGVSKGEGDSWLIRGASSTARSISSPRSRYR